MLSDVNKTIKNSLVVIYSMLWKKENLCCLCCFHCNIFFPVTEFGNHYDL